MMLATGHLPDAARTWPRLALLAAVYGLLCYVLTDNRPFPLVPDDFIILGGTLADLGLSWKRPALANVVFLMGAAGPVAAYLFLNAMTVLAAWLALRVLERVFALRLSWPLVTVYGVLVFAHATAFEHGKYLGLISNLQSHVLGLAAMLFVWRAWTTQRARAWAPAALCYLFAVFTKEDFVLPPLLLLLALWCGLAGDGLPWRQPAHRGGRILASAAFVAIGIGAMAWHVLDANPFVVALVQDRGADYSYAVDLSPGSLSRSAWTLLAGYVPLASAVALATWVLWFARDRPRRPALAFFALAIACLVLPYATIPNNMPGYRAYAWLPWLAALVALAFERWCRSRSARAGGRTAPGVLLLAAALAAGTAFAYTPARQAMAAGYREGEARNRRMLDALARHRAALMDAEVVGLHRLSGLSPWCGNDALYLHSGLGYPQRWIVFADAEDACYRNLEPDARRKRGIRVRVTPVAQLCADPALPVLSFAPDGDAVLRRAGDLCGG